MWERWRASNLRKKDGLSAQIKVISCTLGRRVHEHQLELWTARAERAGPENNLALAAKHALSIGVIYVLARNRLEIWEPA